MSIDQIFARNGHEWDLMKVIIAVVAEAGDEGVALDDLTRRVVTANGAEAESPARRELAYEAVTRLTVGPTPRLTVDAQARWVTGTGWFELPIELRTAMTRG